MDSVDALESVLPIPSGENDGDGSAHVRSVQVSFGAVSGVPSGSDPVVGPLWAHVATLNVERRIEGRSSRRRRS
ncbi:MAG TPA: hypothetical protein VGA62_00680, partial [Acidimicrobiia bacterium]